jgi:hypothetical protein
MISSFYGWVFLLKEIWVSAFPDFINFFQFSSQRRSEKGGAYVVPFLAESKILLLAVQTFLLSVFTSATEIMGGLVDILGYEIF